MKVFIIGPEGAGKTVFATVLNNYVNDSKSNSGLVFRESDIETKKYLAGLYAKLKAAEWPGSTKMGKRVELNWEWESSGRTSQVRLIDASGQDIRSELLNQSDDMRILESLNDSDLVIMLVDLFDHQLDNQDKRTENAWIVQHVLKSIRDNQDLILAVSKADLLTSKLPSQNWTDRASVLRLLSEMMPEFNSAGYASFVNRSNVTVLAFSSVDTESVNDPETGNLIRLPRLPLTHRGLDEMVKAIRNAWENHLARERWKKIFEWLRGHYLQVTAVLALILLVIIISTECSPGDTGGPDSSTGGSTEPGGDSTQACAYCGGDGQIPCEVECETCGGDGWVKAEDWLWEGLLNREKCSVCDGTGLVEATEDCPTCEGTGRVPR